MIRLLNVHTLKLEEIDEGSNAPPYLILSHRWGKPHDEISFKDLEDQGRRYFQKKAWKSKVKGFCHLARKHDFDYVWIDTCCIDKSTSSELSYSIIRMFRWYQKAAACIVHLGDVQQDELPRWDGPYTKIPQRPVWFTRGWTLQELLAPKVVRFYNRDWTFLGTRATLAPQIRGFTGIEEDALHGKPLHKFSFLQRFRWAKGRATSRPEDKVYSLLGLFDVVMLPCYGEGETQALVRLIKENGRMRSFPEETIETGLVPQSRSYPSDAVADYVHFLERLGRSEDRAGAVSARTVRRPSADIRPITEDRHDHRNSNYVSSRDARHESRRIEGTRAASQEISRHSNNAAQRSIPIIDESNVDGYGGEVGRSLHGPIFRYEATPPALLSPLMRDFARRQERELNHREGLWTEIRKDLVVEEAIQEMGHEFAMTDHSYFIFQDLPDRKICHLIGLSDDIREYRRKRVKEIEWESRYLRHSIAEEPRRLAMEYSPSWNRHERGR